jgi:hypothetical protein
MVVVGLLARVEGFLFEQGVLSRIFSTIFLLQFSLDSEL